jgi:hypothetical protein
MIEQDLADARKRRGRKARKAPPAEAPTEG